MKWLNWNDEPRDDENETEIRCVFICGFATIILIAFVTFSVTGCSIQIGSFGDMNEKVELDKGSTNIEFKLR